MSKKTKIGRTHAVIADTQAKPGVNLDYLRWVGEYLVEKRPDVWIHIGDHYDFPSLSSYDKGKRVMEGRRLKDDIEAGNEGMRILLAPLRELQERQRANRKKVYTPELHFIPGNHEERFNRYANDNPELDGFVGVDTLPLKEMGWEVGEFLKPVVIDGIHYVHYIQNSMNGKAMGGKALNILKQVGDSFVMGHRQTLDIAILDNQLCGRMKLGLINGACYEHDEEYKGHQGNDHFRGITLIHEVKDGFGLPMPVSLNYLKAKYA